MYDIGKLKTMKNKNKLQNCCKDWHLILSDGELRDVDGLDLFFKLIIFQSMVNVNTTPLETLAI